MGQRRLPRHRVSTVRHRRRPQLVLRRRAGLDLRGVAARRRGLPGLRRQHHHPRPRPRGHPAHVDGRRRLWPTCRGHAVELRRRQRDRSGPARRVRLRRRPCRLRVHRRRLQADRQDDGRSGVARGGSHVRAEPRRRAAEPELLRRPRGVGADHGPPHRSRPARYPVVAWRVRRRQQLRRRPVDHRQGRQDNGSPGAGYRPDDHGNTAGAATVVPSNGVASGNIGQHRRPRRVRRRRPRRNVGGAGAAADRSGGVVEPGGGGDGAQQPRQRDRLGCAGRSRRDGRSIWPRRCSPGATRSRSNRSAG